MLKNKKKITSIIAVVMALLVIIGVFIILSDDDKPTVLPDLEEAVGQMVGTSSVIDYDTYIKTYNETSSIDNEILLNQNVTIKEGEDYTFSVKVPECLTSIKMIYKINSDNSGDASCSITINGNRPFREANEFVLKRNWMSGENTGDDRGNEYTVPLIESEEWQTVKLSDSTGFHTEPFKFYFKDGKNKITFTATKGNVELKSIILFPYEASETYEQLSENYSSLSDNDIVPITL